MHNKPAQQRLGTLFKKHVQSIYKHIYYAVGGKESRGGGGVSAVKVNI